MHIKLWCLFTVPLTLLAGKLVNNVIDEHFLLPVNNSQRVQSENLTRARHRAPTL